MCRLEGWNIREGSAHRRERLTRDQVLERGRHARVGARMEDGVGSIAPDADHGRRRRELCGIGPSPQLVDGPVGVQKNERGDWCEAESRPLYWRDGAEVVG